MKKFALIGFIVITVFAISMYLYLGGSKPLEYEINEAQFYFQGSKYNGSVESAEPQLLFENARDVALNDENIYVAVINYETGKEDSISQIIGIAKNEEFNNELIESDTAIFFDQQYVKAIISSHSIVMPNPEEVKVDAKAYADSSGYRLKNWSLEIYKGEKSLEVYFPID